VRRLVGVDRQMRLVDCAAAHWCYERSPPLMLCLLRFGVTTSVGVSVEQPLVLMVVVGIVAVLCVLVLWPELID
jgi:hypothetical protein